jgi:hypothetical protein
MVRTQVQLTEREAAALRQLAAADSKSMAALIREAVDLLLQSRRSMSNAERRERAIKVAGKFRSGRGDLAARHDDYLAEDFR